jgi:hypothetical protein
MNVYLKNLHPSAPTMLRLANLGGLLISAACTVGLGAACLNAAEPPTPVTAAAQQLVRQLGDPSYQARQRAELALTQLGVPAKDALMAGLRDSDAEIRARCRRVLVVVLDLDCQARIDAFAADTAGSTDHGLPGWDRYRKLVGENSAARQLFVEMQRAESEMLESAAADPASIGGVLEGRCAEVQRQLYQSNGEQRQPLSVGSVAALIFVAGDAEVPLTDRLGSYLNNFCYQPMPQQALMSGDHSEPLKKLLGVWVGRNTGTINSYQSLDLALRYDLRQGLEPAMSMVKNHAGQQPYMLQNAILAVGKFGDRRHVLALEPLLENNGQLGSYSQAGKTIKTEIRDVALAVLVHLAGQDLKDFGLTHAQKNPQYLFIASTLGFIDNSDRDAALKKWKAWSQSHPLAQP